MTFFTISPQSIGNLAHFTLELPAHAVKDFNESAHVLFSRRVKKFDIKVDTGGGDYRRSDLKKNMLRSSYRPYRHIILGYKLVLNSEPERFRCGQRTTEPARYYLLRRTEPY